MKQLLIILLVFVAVNSNAQWYTRQFGVTNINELNKEQLNIAFTQSQKIAITGLVMTTIGIVAIIGGGITYQIGSEKYAASSTGFHLFNFNNEMLVGGFLIGGGALSTGIGIPLWIVGGNRKNIITAQLAKFNGTSYIPSIGIKITF